MNLRYEYRYQNLLLVNSLLDLALGVMFAYSEGLQDWKAYVWWGISLTVLFRYYQFRKHGFLQVTDTYIRVNHASFKGIQEIDRKDITSIKADLDYFNIKLSNGKKVSIRKSFVKRSAVSELEEVMVMD